MVTYFKQLFFGTILLFGLFSAGFAEDSILGAGSSAAAPLYRLWAQEYSKTGASAVAYESIGSGAGMERIRQRQVDFGASDIISPKPGLSSEGLVMFPTVISGIVPVVNVPHLAAPLRLTGDVLARIYLGEVTHWNAPEIAALNPKISLPGLQIHPVCRGESSGTTYYLAEYLSKLSPAWKTRFGVAAKFDWPSVCTLVKGSSEMSKTVRNIEGAIGYIDYGFVLEDKLQAVQMRNQAGRYLTASPEAFRSAVLNSAWSGRGDFSASLIDLPGDGVWPISMGTFIALPKVARDAARTAKAIRFFVWAFGRGDELARQTGFVPLPETVQASAFREIASVQGAKGEAIGLEALTVLNKPGS